MGEFRWSEINLRVKLNNLLTHLNFPSTLFYYFEVNVCSVLLNKKLVLKMLGIDNLFKCMKLFFSFVTKLLHKEAVDL